MCFSLLIVNVKKKIINLLKLSEVVLVRYISIAFGGNLPKDVAPYTASVQIVER